MNQAEIAVSSRLPMLCLVGAFALIGVAPVTMAIGDAPKTGQAAVLFNPGLDRAAVMRAVSQADVSLVRFGALPGSVVVELGEDSAARLNASGAWVIADPIILGGCQPEFLNNSPSRGV